LELVEGVHIADLLRRTGALPYTVVAKLGAEIAGALALLHILRDAHDRPLNAIHRDISVRNVMVDLAGRVRVLDLGMAYTTSPDRSAATRQGVFVGTLTYLPPEVFLGLDDTPARDIWSLGVLLLEAACGRMYAKAHAGETTKERMARVAAKSADPFSDPLIRAIDPRLLRVLKQMLQTNPADRMEASLVAVQLSAIYAGTRPHEELERRVRQAQQLPAAPKPRAEALAVPPTPTPSASRTEPEAQSLDPDGPTLIDPRRPQHRPLIAPATTRREASPAQATTRSLPAVEGPTGLGRPWPTAPSTPPASPSDVFAATVAPPATAPAVTTPPVPDDESEELEPTVAIECEASAPTLPMQVVSPPAMPQAQSPAKQQSESGTLLVAFFVVFIAFVVAMFAFG
ncbi:MAG TPA: protein kinase, partial [Myxococcota bacterium]